MPAQRGGPVASGGGRVVAASYYGPMSGSGSCGTGLGMTFAELMMGSALGHLKCGTAIRVTYQSNSVVVTKSDIGLGGPGIGGKPRAIDLYIDAAKALGFPLDQGVILVQYQVTNARGRGVSTPTSITRPSASEQQDESMLDKIYSVYQSALGKGQPYQGP